jgi:hypothetical protein
MTLTVHRNEQNFKEAVHIVLGMHVDLIQASKQGFSFTRPVHLRILRKTPEMGLVREVRFQRKKGWFWKTIVQVYNLNKEWLPASYTQYWWSNFVEGQLLIEEYAKHLTEQVQLIQSVARPIDTLEVIKEHSRNFRKALNEI